MSRMSRSVFDSEDRRNTPLRSKSLPGFSTTTGTSLARATPLYPRERFLLQAGCCGVRLIQRTINLK